MKLPNFNFFQSDSVHCAANLTHVLDLYPPDITILAAQRPFSVDH
jgi:hypothetical protein